MLVTHLCLHMYILVDFFVFSSCFRNLYQYSVLSTRSQSSLDRPVVVSSNRFSDRRMNGHGYR